MALLKVFLCQVALLGLYKLFLEQVFEDYLVPDELTRNCLVGLVCLLCFGIQLYTDKLGDEENAEADENSKEKHESKGTKITKMSEPRETVGSKAASIVTTKSQTTSQEIGAEVKLPPNSKQVFESKGSSAVLPKEAEKVADTTHPGIFAQFSPNISDSIPKVIKVSGMKDSEVATSTAKTTNGKQSTTIPVLNGISETNIYDESDEDGIEIDEFVAKKSVKEAEQLEMVKNVELEVVDAGDVTEPKQSRSVEFEEVEEIKPKELTEVLVSECLSANGYCFSSKKDMDTANLESGESPEMVAQNGEVKESFNNIGRIIEETEIKNLKQDESDIREEMTLPSEPCEPMKNTAKPVASAQEMSNTSATFGQTENVDVVTKSNVKTSTLTKMVVTSSEKLHESAARQNVTSTADVCVAPVTIDISFIYACH